MTRRRFSVPARCPAERDSPRAWAQRPLPSMMIATCRGRAAGACISPASAAAMMEFLSDRLTVIGARDNLAKAQSGNASHAALEIARLPDCPFARSCSTSYLHQLGFFFFAALV